MRQLSDRICFFDVSSVINFTKDMLPIYNPFLPGYVRDLVSTRGRVVGLVFSNWIGNTKEILALIQPMLCDKMRPDRFQLLVLKEDNPIESLWDLKRSTGVHFSRCSMYFRDDRFERLAKSAGIRKLHLLDRTVLP